MDFVEDRVLLMRRVLLAIPVAWLAGLATYCFLLFLVWDQTMWGADATAVMFWSFIAVSIAVAVVYWPVLTLLRKILHGYQPAALFAVVAAALGIVPTAMIVLFWGGCLAGLLSPEAQLFNCMFAAVGVVLGLACSCRRESTV